ncbi:hypothetical protein VB715_06180 [Crocosphaera sp. UHCC 0190]|uniref:hypothetical protein n=1 Tax=Crocosphaera sp. UHCC 0190 TaxID=3110246 RepID=UPI002B20D704|nr:hypothetical protein [Crocosphaera sp. UHCC 0190]MEA5509349.1 hypothetical protein [Crocosphaera sp. UHCC 0190]
MLLFDPSIHLAMPHLVSWPDNVSLLSNPWVELGHLFAQRIEDPDIIGKFQKSWRNFIESGQVWALGIGFVIGYMFRSFTA